MAFITLKKWAEREGIHPATARRKAGNGMLATARKLGRDWFIDSSETNKDNRELPNKMSVAERRQIIFIGREMTISPTVRPSCPSS